MNETKTPGKKKILFSYIAVLIGAVMLITTMFMPFASATDDYRDLLENYARAEVDTGYENLTFDDLADISMIEFATIYTSAMSDDSEVTIAIIYMVMLGIFVLFALLTLLFAAIKKPVPIIIFTILSLGAFSLINWDFTSRGVFSTLVYEAGIASIFCYLSSVILIAGSIVLQIGRVQQKKAFQAPVEQPSIDA